MKPNRVRRVMDDGRLALVSYVGLADPAVVEMIAIAGFDGAFIDMEHSSFDLGLVGEMIRVADLSGITPIVRVPSDDPKLILRLLDMGAQGVQIPHIDGVEAAREAVKAVRYPPLGERGAHLTTRATKYGSVPWQEHVQTSNDEVLLIITVEDTDAIEHVDEIAAIEGVDVVCIGPADLSTSLGIEEPNDPRLRTAVEDIARRINAVGKARIYVPLYNSRIYLNPAELLEMGIRYSTVSPAPPVALMTALKESVDKVRDAIGE